MQSGLRDLSRLPTGIIEIDEPVSIRKEIRLLISKARNNLHPRPNEKGARRQSTWLIVAAGLGGLKHYCAVVAENICSEDLHKNKNFDGNVCDSSKYARIGEVRLVWVVGTDENFQNLGVEYPPR